jgi:hypothetical protein
MGQTLPKMPKSAKHNLPSTASSSSKRTKTADEEGKETTCEPIKCNIDYYEVDDEYNRGDGGNSHYVDHALQSNFVSICKTFDVKTMKEAVDKWPDLVQHFPEARYLLARQPIILKHNLTILSCFYLSDMPVMKKVPTEIVREIAEWVGSPPGLPLELLCDGGIVDIDVPGYFANGGGHDWDGSACKACEDYMGSHHCDTDSDIEEYRDDYYWGKYDFPCIGLPLEKFMETWDEIWHSAGVGNTGWEDNIDRNYSLRELLQTLLGAMGYEYVEDAFEDFPSLRDEYTDEQVEDRAKYYIRTGEDYSTDATTPDDIPLPKGTPVKDYVTRNENHCENWMQRHEVTIDNVVRRRLRKGAPIAEEEAWGDDWQ